MHSNKPTVDRTITLANLPGSYIKDVDYKQKAKMIPDWISDLTGERGKEIVYGIGAVVLLGILMPTFGKRIQNVFARTATEGVELVERARSIAARTKEDIEDLIAEANLTRL